MHAMDEGDTWTSLFFSGRAPHFLKTNELDKKNFRPFFAEDDNWCLGSRVDTDRISRADTVQVFWLLIQGHKKYIGKVFPSYSNQDAEIQLGRIGVLPTPGRIDDAVYEFDRFHREARAYSHIDLFCSARERIYFPQFLGVVTDIPESRFSSGYYQKRAIVLEAIRPNLRSRRVLGEDVDHLSKDFSTALEKLSADLCTSPEMVSISPFEQQWYLSLLKDRLRRLDALHRIGITHGDIQDYHFRLPNDIYDTVLYDFSESYTFSEKRPFRVNSGKPRELLHISAGERGRVVLQIQDRAASRDLRCYLISTIPEASVDDALWRPLDQEGEFLELIILRLPHRPDGFSMPTLNSIFPFLEALCPEYDLCWHICRGRLLHHYKPVWVVICDGEAQRQSMVFDSEPHFRDRAGEMDSHFMLCLIPDSWIVSLKTQPGLAGFDRIRDYCSQIVSSNSTGAILASGEFFRQSSSG